MFFPESEAIAREYPDLRRAIEQVDARLGAVASSAPLRPADFASVTGAEPNQVASVFELLAKAGVLDAMEMVECDHCHNLMPGDEFRRSIEDEDDFECTTCGRAFHRRAVPIVVYRMTSDSLRRPKPDVSAAQSDAVPGDEPLGERAKDTLVAMLELDATDSDSRKSTEEIARKAIGTQCDPNSLKAVMADLKTRQLIDSKTGRGGGCWLTKNGHRRAEKLRFK